MPVYEILPSEKENPFKVFIGHDSGYGREIGGERQYLGQALIVPPVNHISPGLLNSIRDDHGIDFNLRATTDQGTLLSFDYNENDHTESYPANEEIKDAFQQLLTDLGRTSLDVFRHHWNQY